MASLADDSPARGLTSTSRNDRKNVASSSAFSTLPNNNGNGIHDGATIQRTSDSSAPSRPKVTSSASSQSSAPSRSTSATSISITNSSASRDDVVQSASIPSSVPKSGRRRDSISSQMRKLVTESPALAAGGGSLNFQRSMGQTITPRTAASKTDTTGLSVSLGSAGELLSSSARTVSALAGGAHGESLSSSNGFSSAKPERAGHTHFGQECHAGQRRGSVSSVATDDDKGNGLSGEGRGQVLHRCEACAKVYRHPSCLIKHRWEHTVYWKEASKFLMSKHQQVQLLEAAAILVGMDTEARSLPEEKALWPAAVSPSTSGLLGSDKVNFETLMAQKGARRSLSPIAERHHGRGRSSSNVGASVSTNNGHLAAGRNALPMSSPSASRAGASSLPAFSASLSPLQTFTSLNLGRVNSRTNGDVGSLRLDESAERSMREESLETDDADTVDRRRRGEEDDDDEGYDERDESMTGSTSISTGSPSRDADERERYGVGAGGDVMAEMEMEMEMESGK